MNDTPIVDAEDRESCALPYSARAERFADLARRLERDLLKARENMRDDFAAAALQGLISSAKQWWWKHEDGSKQVIILNSEYCKFAYEMADAMLAERDGNK